MLISNQAGSAKPVKTETLFTGIVDDGKRLNLSPLAIAAAQVSKLDQTALTGDLEAAMALVSVADAAVSALERIFRAYDLGCTLPEFEKRRELLRDMLRQIAKNRETWPVLYHCREVKRKDTDQMAKQLDLGTATPLKSVGIMDGMMRHLVHDVLSCEIGTPTGKNAKDWPKKALKWMHSYDGIWTALRDPKTWLYGLANPERQRKKRRAKAIKALNNWESKTKRRHRSRRLSVEEAEAKAARLERINNHDEVNEGDIVSGLKEAIAAYLKKNINPQI